jgi:hypothetical protein
MSGGGGGGAHAAGGGLSKLLILWAVDCPHTQECTWNSTKKYAGPALADSAVLRLQLFPFAFVP